MRERRLDALKLPDSLVVAVRDILGIEVLHPPQAEAMPAVLDGENALLAIPTASGKSLVAYIAVLKRLIEHPGSKAIYIVPLKALAAEKFNDLEALASQLGLTVGLAVGDGGDDVRRLEEGDVLVCTSEKLDSLMRTRPDVVSNATAVVADEFHLITDPTRGPTLEVNLTRLRRWRPEAQIIALSATVGNAEELAGWLQARLITSEWRPVPLHLATCADLTVEVRRVREASTEKAEVAPGPPPRTLIGPSSNPVAAVLDDAHAQGGQVLVFVNTRRSAVAEAKRLGKRMSKRLRKEDPSRSRILDDLANGLEKKAEGATAMALAECVRGGVAFHHAGLTSKQRSIIEDAFRTGDLVAIVATPTLAAGVNLPARRVLVRDVKRWQDGGSAHLSVMEVRQMLGRAGRPGFDSLGEGWILAKVGKGGDVLAEADALSQRYLEGPVEDVVSHLAKESALRMHLLAGVANGGLDHRHAIGAFFASTFHGYSRPTEELIERIDEVLEWLCEERFIRRLGEDPKLASELAEAFGHDDLDDPGRDDTTPSWVRAAFTNGGVHVSAPDHRPARPPEFGFRVANELSRGVHVDLNRSDPPAMRYEATDLGALISRMYLDPKSGAVLRTGMRRAVRRMVRERPEEPLDDFGLVTLVASTADFLPFWPRGSDLAIDALMERIHGHEASWLVDVDGQDRLLALGKTEWVLDGWISERALGMIEDESGVTPGDLRLRVDLMAWLLWAAGEILRADDVFAPSHDTAIRAISSRLEVLRRRFRHGCKEELLPLVSIRDVGRARGRHLWSMGFRSAQDVRSMTPRQRTELSAARGWGPNLVRTILARLDRSLSQPQRMQPRRSDDEPLPEELER